MKINDIVVSVNDCKVKNSTELMIHAFCKAGQPIEYEIQRGEDLIHFSLVTVPYTTLFSEKVKGGGS